jgi:hypothetical protein
VWTSLPIAGSRSFRFKRAAFYKSLKGKVGLAAAKAAALRINLGVEGCGIVAARLGSSSLVAHVHTIPFPPRVQLCNRSWSNKHTHASRTSELGEREILRKKEGEKKGSARGSVH